MKARFRVRALLGFIALAAIPMVTLEGDELSRRPGNEMERARSVLSSPNQPFPCQPHDPPPLSPATTVTIEVHGWNPGDGFNPPDEVYGEDRSGGDISDMIRILGDLPNGFADPLAPNQVVGTRYYGLFPPDYYSEADLQEVESHEGIPRYARIIAKYARHVLERSGATGVNFVGHSMGSLVTRYVIEHDLEGLASQGKIARWVTVAGVVTGADLARLFDDAVVAAIAYGMDLIDVLHMNPLWVQEEVAICDGQAQGANNPTFGGILIHHVVATDFTLDEALGLPLLDLINPGFLPNDGVLFSYEQRLHHQAPAARFPAVNGELLSSSHSWHEDDHFTIKESAGVHAAISGALLGWRRMRVVLNEITLLDDHEKDHVFDFTEFGFPPAEVAAETQVTWPYLEQSFGINPLVDERDRGSRVVAVTEIYEGQSVGGLGILLYDAPLLDGVNEVVLKLDMREIDWYPTENVFEWPVDPDDGLGTIMLTLPATSQELQVNLPDVLVKLKIEVFSLF